jgi:putative transposase
MRLGFVVPCRLKADDVRRLKELEGENARLKRIMADTELQIEALKKLGQGNW